MCNAEWKEQVFINKPAQKKTWIVFSPWNSFNLVSLQSFQCCSVIFQCIKLSEAVHKAVRKSVRSLPFGSWFNCRRYWPNFAHFQCLPFGNKAATIEVLHPSAGVVLKELDTCGRCFFSWKLVFAICLSLLTAAVCLSKWPVFQRMLVP